MCDSWVSRLKCASQYTYVSDAERRKKETTLTSPNILHKKNYLHNGEGSRLQSALLGHQNNEQNHPHTTDHSINFQPSMELENTPWNCRILRMYIVLLSKENFNQQKIHPLHYENGRMQRENCRTSGETQREVKDSICIQGNIEKLIAKTNLVPIPTSSKQLLNKKKNACNRALVNYPIIQVPGSGPSIWYNRSKLPISRQIMSVPHQIEYLVCSTYIHYELYMNGTIVYPNILV